MVYKVRFVNYPEHYRRIWDEIMSAIEDCLSHGDLIMRQQLEDFEANLASFVGVKHALTVNSGTDALFFSLKAAGVSPGDEVITVSHTFVATIAAVVYCGAKPVLVDVGNDMNMDVSLIESAITPRTKAIIPVHLNGRICNMDAIMKIVNEHGLFVVEDAAQSLGAEYCGKRAGSFGLTGCFSFYPAKILGCAGDGGAIVTNDDEIARKVKLYRDHGYSRSTGEILLYGYNSRLDNIQAAMLDIKLKYLPEWIERRRAIAQRYQAGLGDIEGLTLPPTDDIEPSYYNAFQNYVIRADDRDHLANYLRESGIEILISWSTPTHYHPALGLSEYKLPVTEQLSREVISLPMYPELSDEDVDIVIQTLRAYYNQ